MRATKILALTCVRGESMSTLKTIKLSLVDRVSITAKMEAICPVTKTVDKYDITIEYVPNSNGIYIELKSLRKFLDSYKRREIYHEDLANEIAKYIYEIAKPKKLSIKLESNYVGMKVTVIKELKYDNYRSTP